MSRPAFPGEHMCEACYRWVHEHDSNFCYEGEGDPADWRTKSHGHFPALCCPDCPCGSFREAHPS